ncbi:MAG: flap structure-specific endonuclease, partial [Halobacteria archaeon]|nr:flap structure-specific endonuclease [Halobacteria archaeon]
MIKENSIEEALDEVEADINWKPIKELYISPDVTDDYDLKWESPDTDGVIDLLCDEHDFSEDRVRGVLDRINATATQSSLDRWS